MQLAKPGCSIVDVIDKNPSHIFRGAHLQLGNSAACILWRYINRGFLEHLA